MKKVELDAGAVSKKKTSDRDLFESARIRVEGVLENKFWLIYGRGDGGPARIRHAPIRAGLSVVYKCSRAFSGAKERMAAAPVAG